MQPHERDSLERRFRAFELIFRSFFELAEDFREWQLLTASCNSLYSCRPDQGGLVGTAASACKVVARAF